MCLARGRAGQGRGLHDVATWQFDQKGRKLNGMVQLCHLKNALELTDKQVEIDIAHRLLPRGNGKAD